jgi:hypothetical protein
MFAIFEHTPRETSPRSRCPTRKHDQRRDMREARRTKLCGSSRNNRDAPQCGTWLSASEIEEQVFTRRGATEKLVGKELCDTPFSREKAFVRATPRKPAVPVRFAGVLSLRRR